MSQLLNTVTLEIPEPEYLLLKEAATSAEISVEQLILESAVGAHRLNNRADSGAIRVSQAAWELLMEQLENPPPLTPAYLKLKAECEQVFGKGDAVEDRS